MTQRELIGRTVTVLGVIAFAVIVAWVVSRVTQALILLLISVIIAAGLAPLVAALEGRRLPGGLRISRGVAIFLIYVAMFVVIAGILSIIIIPAVNETAVFIEHLPQLVSQLRSWLLGLHRQFPWLPDISGLVKALPQQLSGLSQYGSTAAGVAFRFVSGITATITILVLTFYMLLDGARVKRSFLALFPPEGRPRVDRVLSRIGEKFGDWLRAQLLLSFVIAAVIALVLFALGMPFPSLLGVVAGLGELIPMVGLWLGAVVTILVALSQPTWRLIAVVVFYILMMNLEPHILVPRIMSRAVGLSPILTLVALFCGFEILGILGGLIAIPVAAAIQVIAAEVVREIQSPPEARVVPASAPEERVPASRSARP